MPVILLGIFVLLMLALQALAYKHLWDRGLSFKVRFSAKEAYEGDVLHIKQELANKKFLPLPWVNTRIFVPAEFTFIDRQGKPISPEGKGSSLYALMIYTAIRKKHNFICKKRGVYNLREAAIRANDLLHIQQFDKNMLLKSELTVFPKILDIDDELDFMFKQLDSALMSQKIIDPDPFEFRGIRDYQPTDALKSINFKASAIAQTLMVNVHAPTVSQKLMLVLNLDSLGPWQDPEIYEQSIRLTATLAQRLIQQGASISFVTNGRDCVTATPMGVGGGTSDGHLYKIFECLARVSLGYQRAPMADHVQEIINREEVFIFISPYQGDDFVEAFDDLTSRGIAALMIVPSLNKEDFKWQLTKTHLA